MNKRLFVVASLSLLSVLSTACGGDGKRPKIRSFTSTPATLPTLGGETTLVWDVKNADSLELLPDVGAVSGSALTLTVTETTQFTLVAKKDGRVDRKKTTVTCAAPGAVQGVVRFTTTRQPAQDVAVYVNGEATVTDSAGHFYFEDVSTPYDVVVYATFAPVAIIYRGLTRLDPTIEMPIAITSGDTLDVSGVVTPTTAAANTFTLAYIKPSTVILPASSTADNGTGAFLANTPFACLFTCPATEIDKTTGVAIRYTYPGTGLATFTHLGRTTRDIDPAGADVTDFDIAMAPVANAVATGTFELDPWEAWGFMASTLVLDSATGAASDVGILLPPESVSVTTAMAFSASSPDIDGEQQLWSQYQDLTTGSIGIRIARMSPGSTNETIDFPNLPQAVTPLDNGIATDSTRFQISSGYSDSSVKIFSIQGASVAILLVITTESSITLPDLTAMGIAFQDGDNAQWNLAEIAPASSTNDVAGPDGIFGAQPDVFGFTQARQFTYQASPDATP